MSNTVRIRFVVRYATRPGERIGVSGNIHALGSDDPLQAFPLQYRDSEHWEGMIELDRQQTAAFRYNYVYSREWDEYHEVEGGRGRIITLDRTGVDEIILQDTWSPSGDPLHAYDTDPFRKVLLRGRGANPRAPQPRKFNHIFRVKAPMLEPGEMLCLVGDRPETGAWDTEAALPLKNDGDGWSLRLWLPPGSTLSYKYLVRQEGQQGPPRFEQGENRVILPIGEPNALNIVHDAFARLPFRPWRGAGVSIPVFSLRSEQSFGTGEFTDIKLLADWAARAGLRLIQLLPVNDTTATHGWADSYPYSAISAFALHPLYLNLAAMAGKRHEGLIRQLRRKQKQLNEKPTVDYEEVMRFKLSVAREIFEEERQYFTEDPQFKAFFAQHSDWLIPYAAFSYLRDRNGTADFSRWKLYPVYDAEAIRKYVSPKARHYPQIAFYYFLQFHLHQQLEAAVAHAHRLGIIIKGDIPIGVGRHSCETWTRPELFHLHLQSGAPPDDFAVKGQNWQFPIYNWEKMAEDQFMWWRNRFSQMAHYFDAFRIDHILGFFRIWSIPDHAVEGIMGYFTPAIPVQVQEFAQRGMWFNYHRFCHPYITDVVLQEILGPDWVQVLPFLQEEEKGHYALRPEWATQRQVEDYFQEREASPDNLRVREALFDLISNVILFEVPGSSGTAFHFRIDMDRTSSFRHLDEHTREKLLALYYDYFYHRQEAYWKAEALRKLPRLKRATQMLICGEDLGMVPRSVPEVMDSLGILSLEVQRMPKDILQQFSRPSDAPYLSVVTPSTHDMSPIRSWWEEDPERTRRFFNQELGQWGDPPAQCENWISKAIILQHLHSPAMWAIFQLQDLLGMDEKLRRPDHQAERINVPAVSRYYWNYRMHITLERLIREREFTEELRNYIGISGR